MRYGCTVPGCTFVTFYKNKQHFYIPETNRKPKRKFVKKSDSLSSTLSDDSQREQQSQFDDDTSSNDLLFTDKIDINNGSNDNIKKNSDDDDDYNNSDSSHAGNTKFHHSFIKKAEEIELVVLTLSQRSESQTQLNEWKTKFSSTVTSQSTLRSALRSYRAEVQRLLHRCKELLTLQEQTFALAKHFNPLVNVICEISFEEYCKIKNSNNLTISKGGSRPRKKQKVFAITSVNNNTNNYNNTNTTDNYNTTNDNTDSNTDNDNTGTTQKLNQIVPDYEADEDYVNKEDFKEMVRRAARLPKIVTDAGITIDVGASTGSDEEEDGCQTSSSAALLSTFSPLYQLKQPLLVSTLQTIQSLGAAIKENNNNAAAENIAISQSTIEDSMQSNDAMELSTIDEGLTTATDTETALLSRQVNRQSGAYSSSQSTLAPSAAPTALPFVNEEFRLPNWRTNPEEALALTLQHLPKQFTLCDVEGDGNCGPRAISRALYGDESYHLSVRRAAMRYLANPENHKRFSHHLADRFALEAGHTASNTPSQYQRRITTYARKFQRSRSWIDADVSMEAIAYAFNCRIRVWYLMYSREKGIYVGVAFDHNTAQISEEKAINILFTPRHYQLLLLNQPASYSIMEEAKSPLLLGQAQPTNNNHITDNNNNNVNSNNNNNNINIADFLSSAIQTQFDIQLEELNGALYPSTPQLTPDSSALVVTSTGCVVEAKNDNNNINNNISTDSAILSSSSEDNDMSIDASPTNEILSAAPVSVSAPTVAAVPPSPAIGAPTAVLPTKASPTKRTYFVMNPDYRYPPLPRFAPRCVLW
jgi:hypothetical protein